MKARLLNSLQTALLPRTACPPSRLSNDSGLMMAGCDTSFRRGESTLFLSPLLLADDRPMTRYQRITLFDKPSASPAVHPSCASRWTTGLSPLEAHEAATSQVVADPSSHSTTILFVDVEILRPIIRRLSVFYQNGGPRDVQPGNQ